MSETERARVGQALDLLRDALAAYVDNAMVKAYGSQWDERVADEDAKRRPDGRKQRVSKSDLAVMLKRIQHERIAPWWDSKAYTDPRIRSFASEILTLRNMFSHGDDCVNEHVRLLDTVSRFLQLLDLPIPGGLESPNPARTNAPAGEVAIAVPEKPLIPIDLFGSELTRLGEPGERAAQMLARAEKLRQAVYRKALENYEADPGSPAADFIQSELDKTVGNSTSATIGAEVIDLLDETIQLEADGDAGGSTVLTVLALFVRCVLLDGAPGLAAWALAMKETFDDRTALLESAPEEERKERLARLEAAADRTRLVSEMKMGQRGVERWRELIRLAHQLNDGDLIPNSMIVVGNIKLLNDPTIEDDEALRLARDSSARARMLSAMQPGSSFETALVVFLRREGTLCNDLGRSDEATRAFARADEIIDRYPAADPDLAS